MSCVAFIYYFENTKPAGWQSALVTRAYVVFVQASNFRVAMLEL